MATYKFEQFKIEIKNPTVSVVGIHDHTDGTADIEVVLSLGSVNNKTMQFGIQFAGFTYVDTWTNEEVVAWVNNELTKHEV